MKPTDNTEKNADAPAPPPNTGRMPGESVPDYCRRLGFRELPPSGKGYILPASPKQVPPR